MVAAKVNLWDNPVGVVTWSDEKKVAHFQFYPSFIKKGLDIAPLTMPLEIIQGGKTIFTFPLLPVEAFKSLPGLLADSLPDRFGTTLIEEWLKNQNRTPESFSSVERLCYIGKRGMGALEYEPELLDKNQAQTRIEVSEIVNLVNEVLKKKSSLKSNLTKAREDTISQILQIGTSAGGARAKAIIAIDSKTGDLCSGQINPPDGYEHWIIKFDGVSDQGLGLSREYGKIEYAYHKMAIDCGIKMMPCKWLQENGRTHFMTKRFDRPAENEKLHMQTLCAMAHMDYNNPTAYSYEQAFHVMRSLRLPYPDAEQLFTRMVFNDIAKNYDDHTKNISFLMDKNGTWALSPAYDMTFAYDPENVWLRKHQMSINGKRDNLSNQDFLALAKVMNIKKPNEIIEKVKEIVNSWNIYAKDCGIEQDKVKKIAAILNIKPGNTLINKVKKPNNLSL